MFVVHSLAYGLRPIKDYLTLETNPNFLISVYPQTITITITKQWNTHGRKPHVKLIRLQDFIWFSMNKFYSKLLQPIRPSS